MEGTILVHHSDPGYCSVCGAGMLHHSGNWECCCEMPLVPDTRLQGKTPCCDAVWSRKLRARRYAEGAGEATIYAYCSDRTAVFRVTSEVWPTKQAAEAALVAGDFDWTDVHLIRSEGKIRGRRAELELERQERELAKRWKEPF